MIKGPLNLTRGLSFILACYIFDWLALEGQITVVGIKSLGQGERSLQGFNMFVGDDLDGFQTLLRGKSNISGFQSKDLAQRLHKAGRQVSGYLKAISPASLP